MQYTGWTLKYSKNSFIGEECVGGDYIMEKTCQINVSNVAQSNRAPMADLDSRINLLQLDG
jgi:hypothetical protein